MSQHIYLTGYRGTGKTSVGAIVAHSLLRPMIDLDDRVEKKSGRSIHQIFEEGGEQLFRELESESLVAVQSTPPAVVSLGGGAILRKSNRQWIREHGICVWLDGEASTLANRIAGDTTSETRRPALTNLSDLDEIRRLLIQRQPFYAEAANCRIDTTGKTVAEVAEEALVLCKRELRYK